MQWNHINEELKEIEQASKNTKITKIEHKKAS